MRDYEVPDWVPGAMRDALEQIRLVMPYAEQAQRAAESVQSVMPAFRLAQQYAEDRRRALDIVRSVAPIVEYTQRHALQARQALAAAELLFAYADQLAIGIPIVPLADRAAGPRHWTASASLTAIPTFTADAEVTKAADSQEVDARPDALPDDPRPIDYGALAIKLLWSYALVLPFVAVCLAPPAQQLIMFYLATISLALIITWRYNDTRKK